MAQDLMSMLLQKANENKTFADRLRDEREAFKNTASQFAQQTTPQDMYTSNGVALQPSRVSAGRQALIGAVETAASPFSPETELKARGQESDILLQLAQLAEKEKGSAPTIEDILSKKKALDDAGYDTSAIDAELDQFGLKKSGVNVTPDQVQQKIASLKISEKKPITEFTNVVVELNNLKNLMSGQSSNFFENLFSGPTGPIATTAGEAFGRQSGKDLRTALDVFQDKIRKDLFGSVFTENEKKVATLPGSGKQEAKNKRIIERMYNNKLNDLINHLENAGLTASEVEAYLSGKGLGTTNQQSQDSDPLGLGI